MPTVAETWRKAWRLLNLTVGVGSPALQLQSSA